MASSRKSSDSLPVVLPTNSEKGFFLTLIGFIKNINTFLTFSVLFKKSSIVFCKSILLDSNTGARNLRILSTNRVYVLYF